MKKVVVILLSFLLLAQCVGFDSGISVDAAKKPKLNYKYIDLKVGQSRKLKVKNNSKKIIWYSEHTKVAKVNKKGVVVAKGAGTTTVIAIIEAKRLKCKVTVRE